jgi:DNA repair protein RadC
MQVNQYNLRYTSDRIGRLVKEAAHVYDMGDALIDTPEKAARLLERVFNASELTQEYFWLIALSGSRRVIGVFTVTVGTLMASLVHPREVFSRAILAGAASIIISHNHPSGALDISGQDREVTTRIKQAGELLGIPLDDHIIIGENGEFVSAH